MAVAPEMEVTEELLPEPGEMVSPEEPIELAVEEPAPSGAVQVEETSQISDVEAGLIGIAAAASMLEGEPTPEESAPAQIPDLPEWLADLGEDTATVSPDETWTPDQAAMTNRLKKFEEPVPEAYPEPEITKPEVAHLDVNRASLIELERLPGVGFVRAQALVDYRKAHGPFESMIELENVEGFDPDLVDVLRDYAAVFPKQDEVQPSLPGSKEESNLFEARDALSRGNVDGAIQIYQALISQTELLPEVIKDLNDALYRFPVDVSIWMTLGDAEMRSGQVQEALDAYTKAEELLR